ncbi:MAG TPA: hypothetical protein VHM90_01360 [Phycisphaerae bacterium]|jgi:hypothetical protein|nr:hypothetical protein [Phycisphaerae bacterium]
MAAMIEKLERTAASSGAGELKQRLVEHLDVIKRPNDLVRVTQVSSRHFRVNTLSPRQDADAVMQTYHIVKSQFLHVEDRAGELVITDQTRN